MNAAPATRARPYSAVQYVVIPTLFAVLLSAAAWAETKSFNTANGIYHADENWFPFGIPAVDDDVNIGDLPGVQNGTVLLAPWVGSFGSLNLSSGMTFDLNQRLFISSGHAEISDPDTRLIIPSAGSHTYAFQAEVNLTAGATIELVDDPLISFIGSSYSNSTIMGDGRLNIRTPEPFVNDGEIRAGSNEGLRIEQGEMADGNIDLDGSGGGTLVLDAADSALTVVAGALYDSFSSDITLAPGAQLTMDIIDGWMADDLSELIVLGTNNPVAPSIIDGTELTFAGFMSVNSFEARLQILAPIVFEHPAAVLVGFTDQLELEGQTTLNGGYFTLGEGGTMEFNGPTTINGGSFWTPDHDPATAQIELNGGTTWLGGCTIDGVVVQRGNAFVNGPTTIDAGVIDLDGDGDTTWNIWNALVINADAVQSNGMEMFTGSITVVNTTGSLTINLPESEPVFTLSGDMTLVAHPAIFSTRYAGTPLDLQGELSISGLVAMGASLQAHAGALEIENAGAVLRLDEGGVLSSGCAISGTGEVRVGATGTLVCADAQLGGVGLVNDGTLVIEDSTSTERFTNGPGSTWQVSLGGYDAGVNYDQLVVNGGGVDLAGTIVVEFDDVGGLPFAPGVGDEFTILTGADTITGTFDNDPVTVSDGYHYEWTVHYGPDHVRLELDAVVAPGTCTTASDCGDLDGNGIRDDACIHWTCTDGVCGEEEIVFADMGGAFGACPVDGTADSNDRFHALNCFANTDPDGGPQDPYPCETAAPAALNVDAGGPFGTCEPDGVCDGNDAFHALRAFEGSSTCSCPLDGAPAPAAAGSPTAIVDRVTVELRPTSTAMAVGDTVDVDVYIVGGVDDFRGYQLHAVAHPALELVDMVVDDRREHVFAGRAWWDAYNVHTGQMVVGIDTAGAHIKHDVYLATLVYRVTAAGRLHVDLAHDAGNDHDRTFLFSTDPAGMIVIDHVAPAVIEAVRPATGSGRKSR